MRCAVIVDGNVVATDRPQPEPGPGEVLVRVAGAGLNRADLVQRAGFYPAPPGSPPDIPGLEFSGTVESVGPHAAGRGHDLARGDRVFGIAGGGAQAEYLAVHGSHCARVPDGFDLVGAGGVPEAFVTAHDAMVTRASVRSGDWVLIHAVGSGVGTAAVQLATALGARTIGTARSRDKLDRCTELGLTHGIVAPRDTDGALDTAALASAITDATEGHGADVTLDLVGGPYLEADIAAAAPLGRIVMIGTLAGGRGQFDQLRAMQRRLAVFGTMLRSRDVAEKAEAVGAFARDVVPLLASGAISPVIEATLPLARVSEAYDRLGSDATFGKLVLDCG